jgi:integral membrane sensor domain MASE1
MLGLIIIGGLGYCVVLVAGVVLAKVLVLRSDLPLAVDTAVGILFAGAYSLVALAVRDRLRLDRHFLVTRDIIVILVGGLIGAIAASALLSILLLSISRFDWSGTVGIITPQLLGDAIGIAVVTPLVLRLHTLRKQGYSVPPRALFELAGFALIVLPLLIVYSQPGAQRHNHRPTAPSSRCRPHERASSLPSRSAPR